MCGFGNQRMVGVFSLSLSICAASNENDAFVCNACPELVRVHRFLRPRAFVNFVIFWIIHKMIRWYLSLFLYSQNSLSFFLHTWKTTDPPRSRRSPRPSFLPRLSGTFPTRVLYFILPVRSFVRRSGNTTEGSKSFKQSSRKKKRIKIILSAPSPFFFGRLSKSNACS